MSSRPRFQTWSRGRCHQSPSLPAFPRPGSTRMPLKDVLVSQKQLSGPQRGPDPPPSAGSPGTQGLFPSGLRAGPSSGPPRDPGPRPRGATCSPLTARARVLEPRSPKLFRHKACAHLASPWASCLCAPRHPRPSLLLTLLPAPPWGCPDQDRATGTQKDLKWAPLGRAGHLSLADGGGWVQHSGGGAGARSLLQPGWWASPDRGPHPPCPLPDSTDEGTEHPLSAAGPSPPPPHVLFDQEWRWRDSPRESSTSPPFFGRIVSRCP